ncbi:MAG: phytanoyl-CoA dioxygenase family protein [Parvularculaceae bacterium]
MRIFSNIYPWLDGVRIDYGWGGTLAITMSRMPHFEWLTANMLSIGGYSGHGVSMATMGGALAAEAIGGVAERFDVMAAGRDAIITGRACVPPAAAGARHGLLFSERPVGAALRLLNFTQKLSASIRMTIMNKSENRQILDAANKTAPRAQLSYFERSASTDDIVTALKRDGGVIVKEQAEDGLADQIMRELRPHFDEQGRRSASVFNGYKTQRLSLVLAHAPSTAKLMAHRRALEIAEAVLGPHCVSFQIGSTSAIEIMPGEKAQILHRDDEIYPLRLPGAELQLSVLWALTDFTAENGATRVALGARNMLEPYLYRDEDIQQAVMPKGSMLVYLGRTMHGGGANMSTGARTALVNTYSLGWLKPETNHALSYPKQLIDSFPQPLPRLLGYQAHGGHLGLYPGDPDEMWGEDTLQ